MTLTFVDAGVLIAAARGQATFHRRHAEVAFYETYFAATVDAAFDF